MTQKKSTEQAVRKSLCLQDISCTKNLICHSVQGGFWPILLSRLSSNLEDFRGSTYEFLSSVLPTNVLLGSSWVIEWLNYHFLSVEPELRVCSMFWILVLKVHWDFILTVLVDSNKCISGTSWSIHLPFNDLDTAGTMSRETVQFCDASNSEQHCRCDSFRAKCTKKYIIFL